MADPKSQSGAHSDASAAGSAASTDVISMLVARLDAMQTDMKNALNDITTSTKSFQQTAQVGAIATKLDVGSDESQAAGVVLDAGNKRSFDNYVAYQAARFGDRDRTHFDNMQALVSLGFANVTFGLGLCQTLAVVDAHQQCGRNADWRAATIASKHEK